MRSSMQLLAVLFAFVFISVTGSASDTHKPALEPPAAIFPYQNASLPIDQRVDDLIARMTLDEKVSQLVNTAAAIPRLNVPAYDWWSEGLHGMAFSGYATLFPQAIGMAATWDAPLVFRESSVISIEARSKYNQAMRDNIHIIFYGLTIWSPNINIFRDPRWGRGQETYGEDPSLTAQLGVAFVRGLQEDDPRYFRAIATPKHFAVHSGPESTRHGFDAEPTAHDLWDTYLPAFRAAIVDGKAGSTMCAYNALHGKPACASQFLLKDVLRGTWGFKGYVTSDCGAIDNFYKKDGHNFSADAEHAAVAAIRAGTDTNCGETYLTLVSAVKKGLIAESELNVPLDRLFRARFQLGLFDPPRDVPYMHIPFSEDRAPSHHALALRAAEESMVLLKNANRTLPLGAAVKTIGVIGPNAANLASIEGSYNAVPKDPVLPVDGIHKNFPGAKILYAQGSPFVENVPLPVPRTQFHPSLTDARDGLRAEYFANDNFQGKPAVVKIDSEIDFDWNSASPAAGIPANAFSVRWTGSLSAPAPGDYQFTVNLAHCFPCHDSEKFSVIFDGKQVTQFATTGEKYRSTQTPFFTLHFSDAKPHQLRFEYAHRSDLFGGGLNLSWIPPVAALRDIALQAASHADVVIAFAGLSPELEGEEMPVEVPGFYRGDRTDITLPAVQEQLLRALSATGKPLVVVLMNGSALAIPTVQQSADAILEAWYPGESGAQAIADTLFGHNNPAGRLPITFYSSLDQLPPFDDYSMANRTYRYFKGVPLYAFGYGLSYTTFAYSAVKLSTDHIKAGEPLRVETDVRNTGARAGDEVAELYITPPQTAVSPTVALQAFRRIHLQPGESRHLEFTLTPRQLSVVDAAGMRLVSPGVYRIAIAGSQPLPKDFIQFTVAGAFELLP
jgi:beta-glucosidase